MRVCEFDKSDGGSQWLDAKYVGCGKKEDYQLSLPELSQVRRISDKRRDVFQNGRQQIYIRPLGDAQELLQALLKSICIYLRDR